MNSQINSPVQENGDLDINNLLASINRHKILISSASILGCLLSVVYTSQSQPVWKGSFEIVLSSSKGSGAKSGNPSAMLSQIANFGGSVLTPTDLKTEVKILESQSVLRKVFEKDRARAFSANKDFFDDFNFWKEALSVNLTRGTSVLDISFTSKDKSNILPVLTDISATYQEYSMRERTDSLRNGIKFAEEQAAVYRVKADKAKRDANEFSLKYGISSTSSGFSSNGSLDIGSFLSNDLSPSSSLGLKSSGRNTVKKHGDPLGRLAQINLQLIRLEQKFTKKDPSVAILTRERDALKRYLESSASGSISYPGKGTLSKEDAQNILVQYQDLERNADRDQATLESIENTLLSLKLEQARIQKPWELISSPAIDDKPVSPRPLRNLGLGLLAGTLIGCVSGLVLDMRSRKIFDKLHLSHLLHINIALELPLNPDQSWIDGLRLLAQDNSDLKSLSIIPIGNVQSELLSNIRELLVNSSNCNVDIHATILEAAHCQAHLFVSSPGSSTTTQAARLVQQMSLQKTPSIGLIWIC